MLQIRLAETAAERDQCYLLRIEVFVRGQGVPLSMELDDHDEAQALHFLGTSDEEPVATGRVLVGEGTAKIQRVAVLERCRGRGYGRDIMLAMIAHIRDKALSNEIVLDSQTHALSFYERLGFTAEGEEFDDAGIPHRRMRLAIP